MPQKMLIDASHNEETRVVVLESKKVEDFDFESFKKLQIAGNIYLAKVTRVEPSLQAAFLDYGGNRHGFLAFSEIHPDYYQIPVEERIKIQSAEHEDGKDDKDDKDDKDTEIKSRKIARKKPTKKSTKAVKTADIVKSSEVTSVDGEHLGNQGDVKSKNVSNTTDINNLTSEEDLIDDEISEEEPLVRKQHRKFRIQEVIKVRQILLIQVVKDERGNKGAALTTYLSLAGRYCVLMPNTPRGGGISRKITNLVDRKRLKEIANSLSVPDGSGLIVRTAGSNRTKLEIKRDYEYLLRQWEQVRDLTLSSIAPTPIYEEGSLIKRAIRDLYSRNINEVLVEGERGYKEAKDYMKMLMPSHAKHVKRYEDQIPLFSKFEVEDHLAAMFNPIAQLKSGGYIVINVTEALVAVDVNSGRATKESSIEDTALKTNLEASDELARQIKLRDLAGLIVVDFIDMEERKNNILVEKRMKDRLKSDRARTQVGRISMFGLLEMSRQRLRPGMIETSTQACSHCHGTGITRSDDSLSLAILRNLEEEGIKKVYKSIKVRAPIKIANYMLNEKRERISAIENRYKLKVIIEAENNLISPDYKLERNKKTDTAQSSTSIKIDNKKFKEELDQLDEKQHTNGNELNSKEREKKNDSETEDGTLKKRRRRRRRQKQRPNFTQPSAESQSEVVNNSPVSESVEEAEKEDRKISALKNKNHLKKNKNSDEDVKGNSTTQLQKEKPPTKIKSNQMKQENSEKKPAKRQTKSSKKKEGLVAESNENEVRESNIKKASQKGSSEVVKRSGWWNKQQIDD